MRRWFREGRWLGGAAPGGPGPEPGSGPDPEPGGPASPLDPASVGPVVQQGVALAEAAASDGPLADHREHHHAAVGDVVEAEGVTALVHHHALQVEAAPPARVGEVAVRAHAVDAGVRLHGPAPDDEGDRARDGAGADAAETIDVAELHDGDITMFEVTPEDTGLTRVDIAALKGGEASDNAAALRALLHGEPGPYRDIVVLNAAAALIVAGIADGLEDGIARAQQAIDSGKAARALDRLVFVTNEAA